jgi:hypothetical protein
MPLTAEKDIIRHKMRVGNPVLLSVQLMTLYQAADCLTRDWPLSYLSVVFICLRGLPYY